MNELIVESLKHLLSGMLKIQLERTRQREIRGVGVKNENNTRTN